MLSCIKTLTCETCVFSKSIWIFLASACFSSWLGCLPPCFWTLVFLQNQEEASLLYDWLPQGGNDCWLHFIAVLCNRCQKRQCAHCLDYFFPSLCSLSFLKLCFFGIFLQLVSVVQLNSQEVFACIDLSTSFDFSQWEVLGGEILVMVVISDISPYQLSFLPMPKNLSVGVFDRYFKRR